VKLAPDVEATLDRVSVAYGHDPATRRVVEHAVQPRWVRLDAVLERAASRGLPRVPPALPDNRAGRRAARRRRGARRAVQARAPDDGGEGGEADPLTRERPPGEGGRRSWTPITRGGACTAHPDG
jgi:hypothetical protein